jgi:hypothetical protein
VGGLLVAVLFATGCNLTNRVRGSGHIATEQRDVAEFDRVRVSGVTEVTITIGSPRAVSVEADDNILSVLRTEVRDGRLNIYTVGITINPTANPRVTITVPNLTEAETSGATKLTATGLKEATFTARSSGASSIQVSGTADRVTVNASGSSAVRLAELAAREARVSASGAASVEVQASERITGNASGASGIRYSGSPAVDVNTSGAASVRQR